MQYIKFKLTQGQKPPIGSSGIALLDTDWIVWTSASGIFDQFAKFGSILTTDTTPSSKIENELMTAGEIQEYQDILNGVYDD